MNLLTSKVLKLVTQSAFLLASLVFCLHGSNVSGTALAEDLSFPPGAECVAWKAKKRMFLVGSAEPVGKSCKVEWSLKPEGENFLGKLSVKLSSFDSGNSTRDEEVKKLLKSGESESLRIETKPLSKTLIERLVAGDSIEVSATLFVASRPIEETFEARRVGDFVMVSLKTGFEKLGIEAPSVVGGVVAKVRDPLELHAQLKLPEVLLRAGQDASR
jgi:hypothetical protein